MLRVPCWRLFFKKPPNFRVPIIVKKASLTAHIKHHLIREVSPFSGDVACGFPPMTRNCRSKPELLAQVGSAILLAQQECMESEAVQRGFVQGFNITQHPSNWWFGLVVWRWSGGCFLFTLYKSQGCKPPEPPIQTANPNPEELVLGT